jgi:hypothetical protein
VSNLVFDLSFSMFGYWVLHQIFMSSAADFHLFLSIIL